MAEGHLSVKIDGAPAIVGGLILQLVFFVGTKSVFNKVKIKINESHAESMRTMKDKLQNSAHLF